MKIPSEISIGVCVNDPTVNEGVDFTVEKYAHALRRIALQGFKAIEYSHVAHLSESECRQIKDITLRLGMRPWSVHSEHLNSPEPEALAEYLRVQTICARNTAALGCSIMVLHPPNAELSVERMAEIAGNVAAIAGNYNIRAAIENIYTILRLLEIVERADHPNLGVTLDTGHARLIGPEAVLEAIRIFSGRIWTVHLQDNLGEIDDHLPPGLGIIDWWETITALWNSGYEAPLIVELTGYGVKTRRSCQALRTLPLEVEQVLAINYLKYIHAVLCNGEIVADDPVRTSRYEQGKLKPLSNIT